jgi:hypothetical protein
LNVLDRDAVASCSNMPPARRNMPSSLAVDQLRGFCRGGFFSMKKTRRDLARRCG